MRILLAVYLALLTSAAVIGPVLAGPNLVLPP